MPRHCSFSFSFFFFFLQLLLALGLCSDDPGGLECCLSSYTWLTPKLLEDTLSKNARIMACKSSLGWGLSQKKQKKLLSFFSSLWPLLFLYTCSFFLFSSQLALPPFDWIRVTHKSISWSKLMLTWHGTNKQHYCKRNVRSLAQSFSQQILFTSVEVIPCHLSPQASAGAAGSRGSGSQPWW